MKKHTQWIMPILATLGMLAVWFHYEKMTKYKDGSSATFQSGGSDTIIAIGTILLLFLCFRITNMVREHILSKAGINIKFNYDILLWVAIGVNLILPHYSSSNTVTDADKIVTLKYNFGITPNQNYEAISILVIAALVIALRVYAIAKVYLNNSEILQAKNTNIKS